MKDAQNKRAVAVGFFVVIGIVFFITGVLMIGNLHETFKRKIKIVSLFDDVSGLQIGNNIWFSGVKIGTVSNLRFYGHSQVEVSLKIETKALQYIRKDAKVKISTDGLIGSKILVIYGGTSLVNEVSEGDTLEVEKTFSSDDMINTLQANNENLLLITNNFKTLSNNLVSGNGTAGKILREDTIYNRLNAAALSLQNAAAGSHLLISKLNTFSEGLSKKGTLSNQLVTDTVLFATLKLAAGNLQQITDTAKALIYNIHLAEKSMRTPLGILMNDETSGLQLKETFKNLESSTKKLDEDLEAIQHNILLRKFFRVKKNEK
jgi:phospholipid/cholesterol/gamma-HCH transport system substrate-binding protein